MTPAQAANLGGAVAGAVAFASGLIVGWIGGGWLLESRIAFRPACSAKDGARATLGRLASWFQFYPGWRGLLVSGLAMAIGVALGHWAMLGGLIMVVAISFGCWGRVTHFSRDSDH